VQEEDLVTPKAGKTDRGIMDMIQAEFGRLSGAGMTAGGGRDPAQDILGGDGLARTLESIAQVKQSYAGMIENILSGNQSALGSILGLFGELTGKGKKAGDATGQVFQMLQGQVFSTLGKYASQLGLLTGLSSKAFAALKSMNPFAAAAASVALLALGQALKRLSSHVGRSESPEDPFPAGGASAGGAGAGSGGEAGSGGQNRVVNIYINGLRSANPYEVDRALDRAGVDRELRNRFRELVRTGANPALAY
jgi:hypothetical protein